MIGLLLTIDIGNTNIVIGGIKDNQIVFDVLTSVIKASEILDTDDSLRKEAKEKLALLPPMQIGQYGQLQEWLIENRPFAVEVGVAAILGRFAVFIESEISFEANGVGES